MATNPGRARLMLVFGLVAVVVLAVVDRIGLEALQRTARSTLAPVAAPPAPTRVLVVLDTVRADWASMCGHPQPTTPALDALAARPGARSTCRAYTPGSWTLPTHASFFTGRPVLDHGADFVDGGRTIMELTVRPLDDRYPTLAEHHGALGYQTLAVSGNPVVGPLTGLSRGFERVRTGAFGQLEGDTLLTALEDELLGLDPERPLFLFLNIADAHEPWDASEAGHPWRPPRPATARDLERWWGAGSSEREGYLDAIVPLYGWGVQRADRTLARSLALLDERGWLGSDARLVVTSDHGELFGEHGLVDHGRTVIEPNNRVFLVAVGPELPELPEPVSALEVHALVRDGELASHRVLAPSFSDPSFRRSFGEQAAGSASVALWEGSTKWVRTGDEVLRYDLATDPGEVAPTPGPPELLQLEATRLQQLASEVSDPDPELIEMLRAAGYMD